MTIVHAPAAGFVKPLESLAEEGVAAVSPRLGVSILPHVDKASAAPELVVVSPIDGTVQQIAREGVVIVPAVQSPPIPSCEAVVVRVLGGDPKAKHRLLVDEGDEVAAGEELIRWRSSKDDTPSYMVEVVAPEGEVLCDVLEQEVYAAEAMLEVVGPRGEELSPVVALEPDGSVTPADTVEASDMTAAGVAPGQAPAAEA